MSSLLSLVSNEVTVKAKKPRKTTKSTAPPIVEEAFTLAKTNYSPPVEGFQAKPKVTRTFPVYVGPSIYFKRSVMDIFYDKYDDDNLKANPSMVSMLNELQVAPPDLPNYGAMLSTFDAGAISSIPWDADNSTYLQSDIVWGLVTEDASKSIFMKSYHEALLSDPANIDTTGDNPLYNSVLFNISANSPGAAMFLQVSDAVGTVAGQMAVSYASDLIEKRWKVAMEKQILARLEKGKAARLAALGNVSDEIKANDRVLKRINAEIDSVNEAVTEFKQAEADAIAKRESKALSVTSEEKLTKVASVADDAKMGKAIAANGEKVPKKVTMATRLKMGARAATEMAKKLGARMNAFFTKALTKFIQRLAISEGVIYTILSIMNIACTAAAVVTAGILAVLEAIVAAMTAAYTVLDSVCQVLTILLMILLPSLLDKALANGGVCPSGSLPIDQIITDESLYFLFSTFCPIGSLMDVFGPYVCYSPDGTPHMKNALYIPPYFSDSSLSISKHNWPADKTPRGDSTSFADGVPPGWPIVAGIAREPCQEGTWTSSDVDMLCNISTYVPRTYVKKSYVPVTDVKYSMVPDTKPKATFIGTRVISSVRKVTTPSYKPCPQGLRDSSLTGGIGDCWDDLKCETKCWGDWDPSHWGCNTACTGTGGIKDGWHFYERETCADGYELALSLCRSTCPKDKKWNISTDLFCQGTCDNDETPWGVFCTGNSDAFCQRKAIADGKSGNWSNVAGVCWQSCSSTQTDVGALCRDNCAPDKKEVLGVCWDKCAPNTEDIGALCRHKCGGDAPHDVAGVCWGGCGNDRDVGALCREWCRPGFHEVAGVCWGNVGTYARQSMIPKSIKTYDPGYNPPRTKEELDFAWCDFGSETMLDRMAQFYYDQSTLHPQQIEGGRISYEYIVQFYGVTASSELSCDVACQIKTVIFNPVTGGDYEESLGTTYPDDPGNQVSYRRFYFINIDAASAAILAANAATNPSLYKKSWPKDPDGHFTVTGCTNSDYTAPNAMAYSTDPGVDPIMSLPKIYNVRPKNTDRVQFSKETFAVSAATTAATLLVGAVPPIKRGKSGGVRIDRSAQPSMAQQVVGAVAGGLAGVAITNFMNKALNIKVPVGAAVENAVVGPVSGSVEKGDAIFSVSTNNDNFEVDHGPIYECRARDNNGYVPNITFCGKVNTTELLCSHPLILRNTVDLYHKDNSGVHIKSITAIEPRGKDGCYYKFNTTSYNPENNSEGAVTTVKEVVLKYDQNDTSTCVFTPTDTFITDMSLYPVRSYYDVNTKRMVYPTRNVSSTSTVQGRYVRIRPSQNGDGYIRLSQICVYDSTGTNLALSRPVFTNATAAAGSGAPNVIVDGTIASRSAGEGVWIGGSTKATSYIEIDLGQIYYIKHIMFIGQLDIASPTNDIGTRIQILSANGATELPVKELLTESSSRVVKVDFSTEMILQKLPVKPFEIPRPLPKEVNLGSGCPTRCADKNQIEAMITSYNSGSSGGSGSGSGNRPQIIKVTKAFTPKADRCDYEAEIIKYEGNNKFISKQNISFTASSQVTKPNSVIYGRYVRVNAIETAATAQKTDTLPTGEIAKTAEINPLKISQIVVKNAAGVNVALKKKTFATINDTKSMNPAAYGISSLVTDGTLSERSAPSYWSSGLYSDMSIMVDLGISSEISSIIIYGVAGTSYNQVSVEILGSTDVNAAVIYSTTLKGNNTTFTISNFTSCAFSYSRLNSDFSFIQDTTPLLNSIDTSGGIMSFKNITNSIVDLYNTIVGDVKKNNPLGTLDKDITDANTTVSNIVNYAAATLKLTGCENTNCRDPATLTSISNYYNSKNSVASDEYGVETNLMTQITKAGVSGANTCDVMFTNLYNSYDEFIYPPTSSQNSTMIKRFTMQNTGNCVFQVAPGSVIQDVTENPVGVMSSSSVITSPFKIPSCQINCRDPTLLASVKTKMNSTAANGKIPNFTSVLQSFPNGASTCEYLMTKDVTFTDPKTQKQKTSTAIQTYITAKFTMDTTKCSFTLNTTAEADPQEVTTTQDSITGLITAKINGAKITLPYLFNYDNTNPSSRVNETPVNL